MTDLLGIGASGVAAYRTALATVGDNIANVHTEGYTRRSVSLREAAAASASMPLYINRGIGGGVQANAVTRAYDAFKTGEARITASDAGRADARLRWLSTTETALTNGDFGSRLTSFFTNADLLAANPSDQTARGAMLSALGDAADAFRTTADALSRTSGGIANEATAGVASLNSDLSSLAAINVAMRRAGSGTAAQASLADQRDQLIDRVSSGIGVDVKLAPDGTATLSLAGSSGTVLLDASGAAQLSVAQAGDGRLSLLVDSGAGSQPAAAMSGSLAGLIDASGAVTGRRTQLDAIAGDFAADINGWNAGGRTASGASGAMLLILGAGAATLRLATDDPAAIAAASPDGATNGNLIALQPLRSGGSEATLAALVASHALAVSSARAEAAATTSRKDSADAARDEIGGVDLDQEAAELLRFQQAYSGSAKLIQVARETLQSILELF